MADDTGDVAHYRTTLHSTAAVTVIFDRLADFASVADRDPGVSEARLISGDPGQVGARYAVVARFGPRRIPLEYEVVTREDPRDDQPGRVVLVADAGSFTSHDTITVAAAGPTSEVTYDAELTLRGVGRILDIPLHLAFQVIGRRAEAGLREELAHLATASDPRT